MVHDRLILEKRATVDHERKQHERGTESRTSFTAPLHCGPDVSAVVCNKKAEDLRTSRSLSCSICSCAILFRPCEYEWFQILAPGGAGRGRCDHASFSRRHYHIVGEHARYKNGCYRVFEAAREFLDHRILACTPKKGRRGKTL